MSFVYHTAPGSSYRLLELTPELLDAVNTEGELTMKCPAASSEMVVCTRSHTFKLRQMNQTNSLLLLKPDEEDPEIIKGFGSVANYLEPISAEGSADFSRIPKYLGDGATTQQEGLARECLDKLRSRCLISDHGFDDLWYQHAGVEIDNVACLIDESLLKVLLDQILTTVVSSRMGFEKLDPEQVYKAIEPEEPYPVVHSALRCFSKQRNAPFDLDPKTIVKWLGIYVLKQRANKKEIELEHFKKLWYDSVPVEHGSWKFDLDFLVGHCAMPTPQTIRYLTLKQLSTNPKLRFQQLLTVKSTWELDEMVPFIDDLRNKAVKLESFVMKYARKKTVGKKIYISARPGV